MANERLLSRIGHRFTRILEGISMWPVFFAVLAMGFMVTASIISRYFGYPLQPVEEYTGYLAAIITMIGLTYIQRRSAHISIDLLPQSLPPRGRLVLTTITTLVSFAVIVFLFYTGTYTAADSFAKHRVAWQVTETPMGIVQLIVPIGLGLFIIQLVIDLVKNFRAIFSRVEPSGPAFPAQPEKGA